MKPNRWIVAMVAVTGVCGCGRNFDSIKGEQKRVDLASVDTMSLKRADSPQVEASSNSRCEADVDIRYDSGSGQFKYSECDAANGTTTHVFAMTPFMRKSLDAEFEQLTFKKFSVPLSQVCLDRMPGDFGAIEVRGSEGEKQLFVPSQGVLLDVNCDEPLVVNGVFDGAAITRIIKIMQMAVGKT